MSENTVQVFKNLGGDFNPIDLFTFSGIHDGCGDILDSSGTRKGIWKYVQEKTGTVDEIFRHGGNTWDRVKRVCGIKKNIDISFLPVGRRL